MSCMRATPIKKRDGAITCDEKGCEYGFIKNDRDHIVDAKVSKDDCIQRTPKEAGYA